GEVGDALEIGEAQQELLELVALLLLGKSLVVEQRQPFRDILRHEGFGWIGGQRGLNENGQRQGGQDDGAACKGHGLGHRLLFRLNPEDCGSWWQVQGTGRALFSRNPANPQLGRALRCEFRPAGSGGRGSVTRRNSPPNCARSLSGPRNSGTAGRE